MRPHVRRLAAAVLAVTVLVGGTAIAQTSQRFSDVSADHPHAAAIAWAADVGLTVGYDDGTFKPDQPLPRWAAVVFMDRFYDKVLEGQASAFTRGDMMTLLHTIASESAPPTTTTTPPETPVGAWNYGAWYGDYGQEFPAAWVVSDSGRSRLRRECNWWPDGIAWTFRFFYGQTVSVGRLTTEQIEALLSGQHASITYQVWHGHDEPYDVPVGVELPPNPTVDVFETFQVVGAAEAAAWVDRRCKELGWT